MRETGYYWVKKITGWTIAYWYSNYKYWTEYSSEKLFYDKDFEEIEESQIKRKPLIQFEIDILSKYIFHPTKPGYKRSDIIDRIKELNNQI